MLRVAGGHDEHDKFKHLCALAVSASLAPRELADLSAHLQGCAECRDVLFQYHVLTTQGMVTLTEAYVEREPLRWDDVPSRGRLLATIAAQEQTVAPVASPASLPRPSAPDSPIPGTSVIRSSLAHSPIVRPVARMAVAAGLVFALVFGAYQLGVRRTTSAPANSPTLVPGMSGENPLQVLTSQKRLADETIASQEKKLAQLQMENSEKELALAKLRSELRALEEHSSDLIASGDRADAQMRALSQQRDALNGQLQAASQAYEAQKAELASLRTEHDQATLRTSTLEAKIEDLTAANRDQERRLKDTEQFLSSDRDIRELMGARKLYIADVFDVDGTSRTQKPFGRVFYTQGKSLIFYAFDLDREPGVVNASTFQVWGQREAPQGEQPSPMNLGILYRDSESNRRWVMRFDEPKQLAEIDAVFVTVEPRGGSHKPTSKPFLYALLRNEANHP
jgi:hypothetical protein